MSHSDWDWTGILIGVVSTLIVGKLIYSWYNEVSARNCYMKAQLELLSKIAERNTMPTKDIAKYWKRLK